MYKYRRVIISVIALLLAAAILTGLLVTVFAANSADIRTEISGLESKQDELDQKKQELEAQIAANNTQTLNVVEQKAQIDQEIELTRQEVENLNEQIRQYNLLIAEKQAELDQLQTDQNDLLDRYKQRIRAMQEQGDVSYWSIIFGAKTFSEMLNRVSMVEEIAQSDQRMLENMRQIATEVLSAKEELAGEKVSLEEKKTELASAQETLTAKRADSDELLQELVSDADLLRETNETYEAMLEDLTEQIAEKKRNTPMPSALRKKLPRTTITAAITTMAAAITVATTVATTAAAMAAQTPAVSSSRFPQAAASSLHPRTVTVITRSTVPIAFTTALTLPLRRVRPSMLRRAVRLRPQRSHPAMVTMSRSTTATASRRSTAT